MPARQARINSATRNAASRCGSKSRLEFMFDSEPGLGARDSAHGEQTRRERTVTREVQTFYAGMARPGAPRFPL